MKKLIVLALCGLSVSAFAEKQFFDQKSFDQDTAFFNTHTKDAQAIVTLIPATGIDRNMVVALQERANGSVEKWKKVVSGLQKSKEFATKLGGFNYLSECARAIDFANAMWGYAVSGVRAAGWQNEFDKTQYDNAKGEFEAAYKNCKKVAKTPPKKEDYYSDAKPINLAEEK